MNAPTWSTRREMLNVILFPRHIKRTVTIALTVGTTFFTMNQLGLVLSGRANAIVWLKSALTYVTPLIVSNIGVLSATKRAAVRQPAVEKPRRRIRFRATAAGAFTALLVLVLAVAANAGAGQTAGVYRFIDGSPVAGASSTLATSAKGARMKLHTSDLPAGHSVTVWWVIFNEPQNCKAPEPGLQCGPGDLPPFGGDDSAVTSVAYAAGHQIGGSGNATFSGHLATGDTDGALWGPGLVNPTGAEIHLLVRDHGKLSHQQRAEGIHSFGPCNPCANIQFSPHVQ